MTTNGVDPSKSAEAAEGNNEELQYGSSRQVMKLWESRSPDNKRVWLTEPPPKKRESVQPAESQKHAITLRYGDPEDSGNYGLEQITMRGHELYELMEEVIPDISKYYNEAEHGIAMRSPFRTLYWYFDHIKAAADNSNARLREVAVLLRGVLEEEFQPLSAKRQELLKNQEITFPVLWTLYSPGTTCLTWHEGRDVVVKVTGLEYKDNPMGPPLYKIHTMMLVWDGEHLGWSEEYTDIIEFYGRQKIRELDIYPVAYSPIPGLMERYATRGRRFVEIAIKEPYMMSLSGQTLDKETTGFWWQAQQKKRLSQRAVLDARAYNHYQRRIAVNRGFNRNEIERALEKKDNDEAVFIYCCPKFHCFALQRKEWVRVWIDDLSEVVFNDSAYESLVLPRDYKKLLLAFAEAQVESSGFDDVIAGKGQGILMLLAGPPGTGKTLTAESMAEHMRKPLYSVSAGELSASKRSASMEAKLERVLELATRWNAVLLLDEADVFLEKRTDHDLDRNAVVSVFLKSLEYYRGIMVLTTNRIGSFDEAFKSRIHVSIRYPDLDQNSRRTIWNNFLRKTSQSYERGVEVDEAQLELLSQRTLNGREIRNVIKTAQLLASRAKEPLKKDHLDTVWRVEHEESPW